MICVIRGCCIELMIERADVVVPQSAMKVASCCCWSAHCPALSVSSIVLKLRAESKLC